MEEEIGGGRLALELVEIGERDLEDDARHRDVEDRREIHGAEGRRRPIEADRQGTGRRAHQEVRLDGEEHEDVEDALQVVVEEPLVELQRRSHLDGDGDGDEQGRAREPRPGETRVVPQRGPHGATRG